MDTSFSNAPLIFNGIDYAQWKVRIKAYLKGLNDNIWVAIEKGFDKLDGDFDKWSKKDTTK